MVSFHIEPTSKCTLECPLCDRTWFYETFKKRNLHEIDVDNVVNFVGTGADVSMCGNNGDPIYHSKFIELCKKFKDNNCTIQISTNGSAKTKKWWQELKSRDGIGKKALTLLVLTASRSAEIRGMTWDELSLFTNEEANRKGYAGIWVRPPNRMKAKQEHRIPITFEMLKLIGKTPPKTRTSIQVSNTLSLLSLNNSALREPDEIYSSLASSFKG